MMVKIEATFKEKVEALRFLSYGFRS